MAADPNGGEYRYQVEQLNQNDVLLNSIGALVNGDNLRLNQAATEFNIVPSVLYPLETLDSFMGRIVCGHQQQIKAPIPNPVPHITPGYKFNDSIILADSTCFHIGNGIVATAGHCVFDEGTNAIKDKIANMKIVFGLTNAEIKAGRIRSTKVFSIQRVLFGQNQPFNANNAAVPNRADWALIQLQPAAPFPPALTIEVMGNDNEQRGGSWCAGYPWGIGLTMSRPPANKGLVSTDQKNTLLHNIFTAPANSGAPLFTGDGKVVGLVISGLGDWIASRGFIYMGPELGGGGIIPMNLSTQQYRGTKANIWYSLTQPHSSLFAAFVLPQLPGLPNQQTITVEVLFGDGAESTWNRCSIVTPTLLSDLLPNQVADKTLRFLYPVDRIVQAFPNFHPYSLRAISITISYPEAQATGRGARGGGFAQIPTLGNVVFGCLASGDEGIPNNWTVLHSSNGGNQLLPSGPAQIYLGTFLDPAWKIITNNMIGPLDTTTWNPAQRGRSNAMKQEPPPQGQQNPPPAQPPP